MTHFNIEIVSDVVCPWCYVGKNRMDLAIAQHKSQNPSDTFSTTWSPFYLNPDAPTQSVDKQQWYERKFGAQRTSMMQMRLAEIGKQVGINFAFGGKTGRTRDAHRVIQLAKTKGEETQTSVVLELFKAYFENTEDITDHSILKKAAVQGGLSEEEVTEWLESDKGGPQVDAEVSAAKRKFISGVPNFTVNGKFDVQVCAKLSIYFVFVRFQLTFLQGADEPSAFLDIFQQIKSGETNAATAASGNSC